MKLTPSSTARRRTALASSRLGGSPQMPSPVIRMAPNPRRLTVRSPPMSIVPAAAATCSLNVQLPQICLLLQQFRDYALHPLAHLVISSTQHADGVREPVLDFDLGA